MSQLKMTEMFQRKKNPDVGMYARADKGRWKGYILHPPTLKQIEYHFVK